MSHHDELIYWLALITQSRLKLSIIKPIIQRWCIIDNRPLAELFTLSPLEWATTFGLVEADVQRVLAVPEMLDYQAQQVETWQTNGIEPIIYTDSRYPQRLLQTLPPAKQPLILWIQGAVSLLNEPSVAILSSESPDETTQAYLDLLLVQLIEEQISLVNGYGRGFERTICQTILDNPTGQAIAILPMGIMAFHQMTSQLTRAKNSQRVLLVSPFAPETPFNEKLASARELLVDHLAFAMLILQIDPALQTRSQQAIDAGISLFVPDHHPTLSQQHLLEQGAFALQDTAELLELVQQGVIDATMTTSPLLVADASEDYNLSEEVVEPIDGHTALNLLGKGGHIPESLRQRLET